MHSEETDRARDSADRFSLEDFRIRLDSPLFHRDPGVAAAPVARELAWERPAAERTALPTMRADSVADMAPSTDGVASRLQNEAAHTSVVPSALPAMPRLPTFAELVAERADDPPVVAPATHPASEPASAATVAPTSEPVSEPVDESAGSPWTFVPLNGHTTLPSLESELHVPRPTPTSVEASSASISTPSPLLGAAALFAPDEAPLASSVMSDLAALLATSATPSPVTDTPVTDSPVTESLVVESSVTELPVVESPVTEVPVTELPVTELPVTESSVTEPSVTEAPAAAPAPTRAPNVQAELDRLAFLPDAGLHDAAVVLPQIVVAEPSQPSPPPSPATAQYSFTAAPAEMPHAGSMPMARAVGDGQPVPVLSQHEMYMPKAPVMATPRFSYSDFASQLSASRQRKRHPVRKLLATVVLLAMVGGALFAAKYYFLDQRWDADVKPMAAEVEAQRELEFDHAVKVTSLAGPEYAEKLMKSTVGFAGADPATVMAGWRALGLLNGAPDLAALGLTGIGDAPAFYDSGSETIYVVENLPVELRRFALQRALTLALLDQEYGWGDRISGQSAAVQRGTRALYDADAMAVASALLDSNERASILVQQSALYTAYPSSGSSAPFATAVATRSGLAARAYFEASSPTVRAQVQRDALVTDAEVLDLRRLVAGAPALPSTEAQGMLFWYHVLASRVGNDQAWQAALYWRNDSVSFVQGAKVCVTALVIVDPAAHDYVFGVFQAWAGAGPAASATQIGAPAAGQITVSACDPGQAVASNDGRARLTLGGAPLRSEQFHQLAAAYPQAPAAQIACAVYGTDSVSPADERSLVDTASGWLAPANHPSPDPNRAGCTA